MRTVHGLVQRVTLRAVVVGVVALALVVLTLQRGLAWRAHDEDENRRGAAVAAASAEVIGLISISGTTYEDDVAALLAGATSTFREELEAQTERLSQSLTENRVAATGEVVSAGITSLTGDTAVVVVAASGTVMNKQTERPTPRNYRLEVSLQEEDDRWLVSGLEFVA